jgi:nucleotide-binding universal stress UspA family protein
VPGIIVGIDGSDHSRRALEWATREAALRHAPLTVLTVRRTVSGYVSGPIPNPDEAVLVEQARAMAQEQADGALEKVGAGSQPESVTVQVIDGLPAKTLLEAATGADMLVVGSRGAGGFQRLLLGSVSTQVTHHAPCPVVVITAGDA